MDVISDQDLIEGEEVEIRKFVDGLPFTPYEGQMEAIKWIYYYLKNEVHKNMLVVAPTGSGKTLIEHFVAYLATIMDFRVLFTNPLRALSREKVTDLNDPDHYMSKICDAELTVVEDTGATYKHLKDNPELKKRRIKISTAEKFLHYFYSSSFQEAFENVRVVVIDEIHHVGTHGRGAMLEMALMTLKHYIATGRLQPIMVIGLSATLPNYVQFGNWLDSQVILLNDGIRPVPLEHEYHMVRGFGSRGEIRQIKVNFVFDLVNQKSPEQFLVFCPTRQLAEDVARRVGGAHHHAGVDEQSKDQIVQYFKGKLFKISRSVFPRLFNELPEIFDNRNGEIIPEFLPVPEEMRTNMDLPYLNTIFRVLVGKDDDIIVEIRLRVISATPTLAQGINLPARNVIMLEFDRYNFYISQFVPIPGYEVIQSLGRAGRMGFDDVGYAHIIGSPEELRNVRRFIENPEPTTSQLLERIDEVLLRFVVGRMANSKNDLEKLLLQSFASYQNLPVDFEGEYEFLLDNGLIEEDQNEKIKATRLGYLIVRMFLNPRGVVDMLARFNLVRNQIIDDNAFMYLFLASAEIIGGFRLGGGRDAQIVAEASRRLPAPRTVYGNVFVDRRGYVRAFLGDSYYKMIGILFCDEWGIEVIFSDHERTLLKSRIREIVDKYAAIIRAIKSNQIDDRVFDRQVRRLKASVQYQTRNGRRMDFLSLPNIGVVRLSHLERAGITNINKFSSLEDHEILKILSRIRPKITLDEIREAKLSLCDLNIVYSGTVPLINFFSM